MKPILFFLVFSLFSGFALAQTNNAYGDNQKQVEPGVWAIYSGDVNQDGVIDLLDQIDVDNDVSNFSGGYVVTDLNGDATVDLLDQIVLDNNVAAFIGVVSPLSAGSFNSIRSVNSSAPNTSTDNN